MKRKIDGTRIWSRLYRLFGLELMAGRTIGFILGENPIVSLSKRLEVQEKNGFVFDESGTGVSGRTSYEASRREMTLATSLVTWPNPLGEHHIMGKVQRMKEPPGTMAFSSSKGLSPLLKSTGH